MRWDGEYWYSSTGTIGILPLYNTFPKLGIFFISFHFVWWGLSTVQVPGCEGK